MADVLLEDVSRVHADGTVAVDHLNLHVRDGELLVLLGPSGCGKSTTLRLIAGAEPQSGGTIMIGGRVVSDLPPHERDVAMVFEQHSVYPHLSAGDNLRFGLTLRHLPKEEIDQRVQAESRVLRIVHLLERLPKSMSAGQRQRVALGRATVRVPAVFLLDEPLTHIDEAERVRLRTELAQLQRGLGVTTIYVTHDQAQAMAIGDRAAVMRDGKLMQVDQPRVLYERPGDVFVATFVGSPAMSLLAARLERGQDTAWIRLGGQRLRFPGEPSGLLRGRVGWPVTVGVRAEHLSLATPATPPDRCLAVTVTRVDHLGPELLVACEAEGEALVARLPPLAPVHAGEGVELAVDTARLSFFDPVGGTALWHGAG